MYLVELFDIDQLEKSRHGVGLVGQPGPSGQCDDFGSVLLRFERYPTVQFEKADFHAEHLHIRIVLRAPQLIRGSLTVGSLPGTDLILT
eukprot:380967-Pyramimonas_sp.AAC.1